MFGLGFSNRFKTEIVPKGTYTGNTHSVIIASGQVVPRRTDSDYDFSLEVTYNDGIIVEFGNGTPTRVTSSTMDISGNARYKIWVLA